MKLAIDADPIGRRQSGNETFLRGLIGGLQGVIDGDDSLLLVGSEENSLAEFARSDTEVVRSPRGPRGDLMLGWTCRRRGADALLANYNAPIGFGRLIATIVHDISFLRYPEAFPKLLRQRIRASVWYSTRASDLIITPSEFSKAELLATYGALTPDRVVVVPGASAVTFARTRGPEELAAVREKLQLPDLFLLAVGNVQPRKNFPRIARAAAGLGVPLVVAGQPLWNDKAVRSATEGLPVQWLGYVTDAELACLYRLCAVFVFPSIYEGFGLPVIEAMTAGAPVVTSATTSLAEVAATAAQLVEPTSVASIRAGLEQVLGSDQRREELIARGRERAAVYSWEGSARSLLAALRTHS